MGILPRSTNERYAGSLLSAWFLTLFSVLTIVPGCIHTFAPDGGAGTIAGLDLSQNGRVIVGVFAWAGATQIAFGLALLIVSLRYRDLVPLMLLLAIVERSLHALNGWILKPGAADHHPPEHYAVLLNLALLAAAFALSLRSRAIHLAIAALLTVAVASARAEERITPLLLAVHAAPVPFDGSDGRVHLVYELWITNFSSGDATVEQVDVLGDGRSIATLDAAEVATRLQPAGRRDSSGTMSAGGTSLLFVHLTLPAGAAAPARLSHAVRAHVAAAPPDQQEMTLDGGDVTVDRRAAVVIGPPLRGDRYIAADSCCDASRHTRAALPVDGQVRIAQRFAVDWEQMDGANRIYVGPREQAGSYAIYGEEAVAVADARVASVVDGLPEQTPGEFPAAIALAEADGNSVILDLGDGRFALYAHLQPGSLRVRTGERVARGQVLGRVGNSGNSVAPHLHFHVMDGASPLASNGLPYEIDAFDVVGHSPGTAAFDLAEEKGSPLAITPVTPPQRVKHALPLDQSIVRFAK